MREISIHRLWLTSLLVVLTRQLVAGPVGSDLGNDCGLDLDDHATYIGCIGGPNADVSVVCANDDVDADDDADVDIKDWSTFQTYFWNDTTFVPSADYGVGMTPYSIARADLNGDNHIDLATANYGSNNISVLLNNGDGTFAAHVLYGVGSHPSAVTAADLNGDENIDLAVANFGNMSGSDSVSVLINNGNGTFASHVPYGVGMCPLSVTAADLDGDNDMDLAVGNGGGVSVLLNNGSGTFATHIPYGPARSTSVVAADLDGDIDVDLAYVDGTVRAFIAINNGNGTFSISNVYFVGIHPRSIVAANLDTDGDVDLAVADYISSDVFILQNNGNGTFATHGPYAVGSGSNPYYATAADMDGDNDVDIVLAIINANWVSVLLNNGNGTFAPPQFHYGVGSHPVAVTVADLDDDTDIDMAVTNNGSASVSILINPCNN